MTKKSAERAVDQVLSQAGKHALVDLPNFRLYDLEEQVRTLSKVIKYLLANAPRAGEDLDEGR